MDFKTRTSIKIGVVDDHTLFRRGLAGLIESISENYKVAFEADNGLDLQTKLDPANLPDVITIDVNMPKMDGFATVKWLNETYPSISILVLSMIEKEQTIVKMLQLGVKGYLSKDVEPQILGEALEAIMKREYYYTDFITGKLVHSVLQGKNTASDFLGMMNDRERTFLQLACSELTYNEIAAKMYLSPKTIDGYRDSLFEKLNVRSRVGLALFAIKHDLVQL